MGVCCHFALQSGKKTTPQERLYSSFNKYRSLIGRFIGRILIVLLSLAGPHQLLVATTDLL